MSERGVKEATHTEPLWRDRANFIIASLVDLEDGVGREQLWARQIGPFEFEISCIPFFAYDLALGDIVRTSADYVVQEVIRRSGRYVFRVWLGGSSIDKDWLAQELVRLGGQLEWSSTHLLAVDAPDEATAARISSFLADLQERGELVYETGRTG